MKLSTKARYGLRAVVDLAANHRNNPVPMTRIAGRQGISRKYLHAILSLLKSAGLVRSVRGAQGGYALARDPSEIHVLDVLEALEGSLSVADCVEDRSVCERAADCVTREVWRDLSRAIEDVLSRTTLADLLSRAGPTEGAGRMYYI